MLFQKKDTPHTEKWVSVVVSLTREREEEGESSKLSNLPRGKTNLGEKPEIEAN
jgi:hypothetical protein